MRRFLCPIVLALGCAHSALAQQAPQPADAPLPASPVAASPALWLSQPPPETQPSPENARLSGYLIRKFGVARDKAVQIANAVDIAASKYSLPPAMLLAIISIESRFKEKARGANGATGLMQVVPSAHRGLLKNTKDLTEPTANIDAGSAILYGYLKSARGDVTLALKKYGGSTAYAEKIQKHVGEFSKVVDHPASAAAASDAGVTVAN
jgi:soluble lytic murein transglycosylase-like protein